MRRIGAMYRGRPWGPWMRYKLRVSAGRRRSTLRRILRQCGLHYAVRMACILLSFIGTVLIYRVWYEGGEWPASLALFIPCAHNTSTDSDYLICCFKVTISRLTYGRSAGLDVRSSRWNGTISQVV